MEDRVNHPAHYALPGLRVLTLLRLCWGVRGLKSFVAGTPLNT